MKTQLNRASLKVSIKHKKVLQDAGKLLQAPMGAMFKDAGGAESRVVSRFFQRLQDNTAVVTVLLETGNYFSASLSSWQEAVDSSNEHDLVVEAEGGEVRYSFVFAKDVYTNSDLPVAISLHPAPSTSQPEAERAPGVLLGYRGCQVETRRGVKKVTARTLYADSEQATFVVESDEGELYYHTGAISELYSYAVPGDFFVNEASAELSMIYGVEINGGIVQLQTTPVYFPDPIHTPSVITREMLDVSFKDKIKVEDDKKLLAAHVGSYFAHPELPGRSGAVVSRYLHFHVNGTVTIAIVVNAQSLHFFYVESDNPQAAMDSSDLFDIVVRGQGEALVYSHIGQKTISANGVTTLSERGIPTVVPPEGEELDAVLSAFKGSTFVHAGQVHQVADRAIYALSDSSYKFVAITTDGSIFQRTGGSAEVLQHSYKGDFELQRRAQRISFVYAKNRGIPSSAEIYLPSSAGGQ